VNVTRHSVVKLEWTLEIDGKVLERSLVDEPQTILLGHKNGLPLGLEAGLIGRQAGNFEFKLEDAHGAYDPSLVHRAKVSDFPTGTVLELEGRFYTQDANGKPLVARIVALEDDAVTVDFNHRRAGKTLEYRVHILSIRAATVGELEHGHVHGEGGVSHHHD
jgi:FKBP-type peptidyl-prolyl cis-trans isomerase SlyD